MDINGTIALVFLGLEIVGADTALAKDRRPLRLLQRALRLVQKTMLHRRPAHEDCTRETAITSLNQGLREKDKDMAKHAHAV